MASGWYASRKGVPASWESHTVRLYMDPKWWDILDRVCTEKEWTRGHMVALIVQAWCRERAALDANKAASDGVKEMLRKGIEEARL